MTYVSVESGFVDSTTSFTINRPAAAIVGDTVIVQTISHASSGTITNPSGWTNLQSSVSAVDYTFDICYRVIQSGDTSWTWDTTTANIIWSAVTLRDVGAVDATDLSIVNAMGTSTTVVPTQASTLVSFTGCDISTSMSWTADTGTERLDETLGVDFLSHGVWTSEDIDTSTTVTVTHDYTSAQDIHLYTVAFAKTTAGVSNLYLGGSSVDDLFVGSTQVDRVYLGSTLVWKPPVNTIFNLFPGSTPQITKATDTGVSLSTEFKVTSAAQVTKLRYLYPTDATGTNQTMAIYEYNNLTPVYGPVSVPASVSDQGDWVEHVLPTPFVPTIDQDYYVTTFHPDGEYAAVAGYFTTGGDGENSLNNGPLYRPNNADSAEGQGRYNYGTSIEHPDGWFNSGCYFSDVVVENAPAPTYLWQDTFDRADATGLANVGNGWTLNGFWNGDANITNNMLERTNTNYEWTSLVNPAGGTLPADLDIEVEFPHTYMANGWFSLVFRYNPADNTGVRVGFQGLTEPRIGNVAGQFNDNTTLDTINDIPADFLNATAGTHTIRAVANGTNIEMYVDGVHIRTTTFGFNLNSTLANGYVGFTGWTYPQLWDRITVSPITP